MREAREEIGVVIKPEDLRLVHVMHRLKNRGSDERLDFFFLCTAWEGNITNKEPRKCDDLLWIPFGNLPPNTIPYIRQAIECFRKEIPYSEIV